MATMFVYTTSLFHTAGSHCSYFDIISGKIHPLFNYVHLALLNYQPGSIIGSTG